MSIDPRLIVTGHRPDATSEIVVDQPAEPLTVSAYPGSAFYLLWGTEDGGASVGGASPSPCITPFFPGIGGSRVLFARYEPESSTPQPVGDPAELAAEVDELLPGLREVFDPDDSSGMHATDTVDYGICLEGELTMQLDNGAEVVIGPGACVVQQGTRHAWHNRGDQPALMCFVAIGAYRKA